jgi:NAD(P)-dependent dehydrogenase (short-subunit alcohol dehydrogenase family)
MPRNIVITGANRGIGLALARHYHAQGDHVVGVCRDSSAELDLIAKRVLTQVDVCDPASVAQLAVALRDTQIDILINNAGIFLNETLQNMNFASIEQQMQINAYGPLRVAHTLLGNFIAGSKIANITSRMGSIADNTSGAYYGYRASKAALNALGKSLAVDLKPRGIYVAQLHPGYVQTRMVGFSGEISPEQAAAGIAARIEDLNGDNSGGFWHSNGAELPW